MAAATFAALECGVATCTHSRREDAQSSTRVHLLHSSAVNTAVFMPRNALQHTSTGMCKPDAGHNGIHGLLSHEFVRTRGSSC